MLDHFATRAAVLVFVFALLGFFLLPGDARHPSPGSIRVDNFSGLSMLQLSALQKGNKAVKDDGVDWVSCSILQGQDASTCAGALQGDHIVFENDTNAPSDVTLVVTPPLDMGTGDNAGAADFQNQSNDPSMPSAISTLSTDPSVDQGFEGAEKKLEVVFSESDSPAGFRMFGQDVWSDVLVEAQCSILNLHTNGHFDAYLLSESSLFVYPSKVIIKTCGVTRLLLLLPKLLDLARQLGVHLSHVQYSHFRYKFPEEQFYPHQSLDQERDYLAQFFPVAHSQVIGPAENAWSVLLVQEQPSTQPMPQLLEASLDEVTEDKDVLEVSMEGLSASVREQFFESSFPELKGRALAQHMTSVSRIGALLPNVTIDDWAFAPCGYSMNGLRDGFYYTIHITPEDVYSYASFETNDPRYRKPALVQAIVDVFAPTEATVTLTTRRPGHALSDYALDGFERVSGDVSSLGPRVSVATSSFVASL